MAIIATPGGADANSYVTQAEADAYFAARFGSAVWTALDATGKETALRHATRNIDANRFRGWKVTTNQALEFPRYRPNWRDELGLVYPANEIPKVVKDACCEEAIWVAQHAKSGGSSPRQQLQSEGVSSFTVGDLSETYAGAGAGVQLLGPRAQALLRHWIDRGGQVVDTGRERPGYGPLPRIN